MTLDRREILRLAGVGCAALAAGVRPADAELAPSPASADSWAVLMDTVACIGCRKCEWACNVENRLSDAPASTFDNLKVVDAPRRPEHDSFTVVNRFRSPADRDHSWTVKLQCMHCADPACASACLVGALAKDQTGPVTYDAWKCIGCRYCMVACPFQIPAYEYNKPVQPQVRKCTFCAPRLAEGRSPACVAICPNEALTFGRRQVVLDAAHTRIQASPGRYFPHVYGESEAGGTSWLYLAPVEFAYTGLPALDDEPIPHHTERIQHAIFKSFVPPLALYGVLGLVMHALRGDNGHQENTSG
ncbi:MAG: 4Fe-4S ferredoxin [Holophagae bacterium]|nr:MAG: 4Fe-4S ferredoxin [Holophagae bacterium]